MKCYKNWIKMRSLKHKILIFLLSSGIFLGFFSILLPINVSAQPNKPSIISRTEWGCPHGQSSPLWTPQYYPVSHIILHHTVSSNSITDWENEVYSIWYDHTYLKEGVGWGDIGYNFLIDPNGIIYEGRAGGDNVIGGHAKPHNFGTMGIAFLGTFISTEPTIAALSSATSLIAWKCAQNDIDPLSSGLDYMDKSYNFIAGHKDVANTECPGSKLYNLLPLIRQEVKLKLIDWQPADDSNFTPSNRESSHDITYIVIHVAEGTYQGTISEFQRPESDKSAHYVISKDGAITAMVHDKDIGWHAGNWEYNKHSIGIEHEGYVNDPDSFTEELYQASAALVRHLAQLYNIQIINPAGIEPESALINSGIIGHNQVPDPNDPSQGGGAGHHSDPGPYWDWEYYMKLIKEPITYSFTPIDIILVLDRSGSMSSWMGSKTKIQGAKDSAVAVIDSLMPSDRVGVVSFSSYGSTDVHLTSDFDYAKAEVQNINAGGMTSFGAGMQLAVNELENYGSPDHTWAIIFMSNGWHNTAPYPDPYIIECNDLGIPIYTVGLGSYPSNVNEPLLKWMASETGGKYLFAPSLYELQNIFLRFSLEITGWIPENEFSGTVFEDQSVVAGTFEVVPDTQFVRVTLNWPGSDLDLNIERPDGTDVDFINDLDAIYSGSTVKPEWAILNNPQEGIWTVKIYGKEINSPDEFFIVWVSSYTPPAPHDTDPPIISIEVPFEDQAIQDGVNFKATVTDLSEIDWVTFSIREPNGEYGNLIDPIFESLPGININEEIWQYMFETTLLPDGYYLLLVKTSDIFGNESNKTVQFSIRNWACLELLPASVSNKAGRTMPVKFSMRIFESVDPAQPFVYNEELTIKIYDVKDLENPKQTSWFGTTSRDYRIDSVSEKYITNFKTSKIPTIYIVEIWRRDMLIGTFEFETVK